MMISPTSLHLDLVPSDFLISYIPLLHSPCVICYLVPSFQLFQFVIPIPSSLVTILLSRHSFGPYSMAACSVLHQEAPPLVA